MNKNRFIKTVSVFLIFIILLRLVLPIEPTGAQINYNATETKPPAPAEYLNTSGGTFTTLVLYAETQNPRWKAYAGNVTGTLTLDDAQNYTIYNWELTVPSGQVYASRNSSIEWSNINCSNLSMIYQEETIMSHTTSNSDSINSTFRYRIHRGFYVAERLIKNSTCPSIATWVNDTPQAITEDALFQEMLLSDNKSLVYATLMQDSEQGFNFKNYDFQMIVAERDIEGPSATPYYFWVELV